MSESNEKHLKLYYSLPDFESDSENEADEEAAFDLEELENCEIDDSYFDENTEMNFREEDNGFESEECNDQMDESDSEEDNDIWNQNTKHLDKLQGQLPPYDSIGAALGLDEDNDVDEIDFFNKIWDLAVISKIVEQTNLYARQKQVKNWVDVTVVELRAFFGCLIMMGIHRLPSLKCYWSSDPMLRVDEIARVMTGNRYGKITQNLHCNNNENILPKNNKQNDKLHKLRPLLDILNQNIGKVYRPSSFVVIDESMIAFKGRSMLKQYMPNKPIKRGYKVWCLADSTTGFIIGFIVYTGKEEAIRNSPLGERVVLSFADKIRPGSVLVLDNFFTSVSATSKLLEKKIYSCGTVRSNSKNLPAFMKKSKEMKKIEKTMKRGEFQFAMKKRIAAVKWMDRKGVNFLSSIHSPRQTTTVRRRLRNGSQVNVHCPKVVETYNKFMGGVDRFDQLQERYRIGRRSIKWWHRIFYYLLDLAIVNSFVLWKLQQPNKKKCNQLTFRMKLARQLINGFSSRKTLGRPTNFVQSAVPNEVRLANVGCHFPRNNPNRRRCKFCSGKNRKEQRTYFTCSFCQVPLCVTNCFEKFHQK